MPAHVGRARRTPIPATSRSRPCRRASPRSATRRRRSTTCAFSLQPLLDLAARDEPRASATRPGHRTSPRRPASRRASPRAGPKNRPKPTKKPTERSTRVGLVARSVDVMAVLVEHGVLLESARDPIPNVAELVAGEPITGSWWAHHDSHAIFARDQRAGRLAGCRTPAVREGEDHARPSAGRPALVRVADHVPGRSSRGDRGGAHRDRRDTGRSKRRSRTGCPPTCSTRRPRGLEEQAARRAPDHI